MIIGQLSARPFDISSEVAIITAVFTGSEPQLAVSRIDLVGCTEGGSYEARIYINDNQLIPDAPVVATHDSASLHSRTFAVNPSDVIKLSLSGLPSDVAVQVAALIMTAGFNNEELTDALSRVQIQPILYVLAPQQRQPIDPAVSVPQQRQPIEPAVFAARPSIQAPD